MGVREREYRARITRAADELRAEDVPPPSAEAVLRAFFRLMDTLVPVVETLPWPVGGVEEAPEMGLYQRWRELESRRRNT